jgi:hypothetical protein
LPDDLARHIHVELLSASHGERTKVRIDHRIPADAEAGRPGLRVTTNSRTLFRAHFDSKVRKKMTARAHERGRRLYCEDLDRAQVLAVLTYHIDERGDVPILITSIGQRADAVGNPQLTQSSRFCAALLKQYVHAISAKLGRGPYLDYDSGSREEEPELERLGFKPAPRVEGRRPGGKMWRQDATQSS